MGYLFSLLGNGRGHPLQSKYVSSKRMSLSIYSIVATTPAHLDIFDKLCPVSMASLAASHCSAVSGFALLIFLTTPMQLFHD